MQKDDWTVGKEGIRPAGPPDRCLYCGEPEGRTHKPTCAVRERTVVVRMVVEYVVLVTESADQEMIEFHRNNGRWCANNALVELEHLAERVGCLCDHARFELVREATAEDEERDKCYVANAPS